MIAGSAAGLSARCAPSIMRIAVDVMGGDHGCTVVIEGVNEALAASAQITELHLVGQQAEIEAALRQTGCADGRVRIVHASEVIAMEDKSWMRRSCASGDRVNIARP